MKAILMSLVLFSSVSTLAMHAYNSKECSINGKKFYFELAENPTEGMTRPQAEEEIALTILLSSDAVANSGNDAVLKIVHQKTENKKYDDGCFQGKTFKEENVVQALSVTTDGQYRLGLNPNQTFILKCVGETIAPSGKNCR